MRIQRVGTAAARGFALIVTLSLMILLTVIAVGLLTLSSVSLRSSASQGNDATARANARMALMIAISELQKTAGPDQRITGRTDLLNESSPNPMWTAVWNSQGGEPAILVSGNELKSIDLQSKPASQPTGYFKPETKLANDESVALFGKSLAATEQVRVPTVKITGTKPGTYAWWVADEGIKARFNTPNPYAPGQPSVDQQKAVAISQNNSTRYASKDLKDKWPVGNLNGERAITLGQGQLVAPDVARFSQVYFESLTPYSQGLLTDVKNGGLKRDLTLAFEDPAVFKRWFGRDQETLTAEGSLVQTTGYQQSGSPEKFFISDVFRTTMGKEVGPNWGIMEKYYNLYKSTPNSTVDSIYAHPPYAVQLRRSSWNPYTEHRDPEPRFKDVQHTNSYVTPMLCRAQAGYRMTAAPSSSSDPTHAGSYVLELEFKPVVGVWNPYNVTFNGNVYKFDWELSPVIELEIAGNTYSSTTGGPKNGTIKINMADWYSNNDTSSYIGLATNTLDDISPGELRMFSTTTNTRLNWAKTYKSADGVTVSSTLKPTWGENGFFRMVLPAQFNTPTSGTAFAPLRVSKTATITIKSLALSEQVYEDQGWQDTAGNFMTLKPGWKGAIAGGVASAFRTTNFWQPGQAGLTPEPVDSGIPPTNAQALQNSPVELATWAFVLRQTKSNPGQNIRNLIDSNVRACNLNSRWDGSAKGDGMTVISPFRGEGKQGRGLLAAGIPPEPQAAGSRYNMLSGDGNQSTVVIFDLPLVRPLSLGQFQNATLARYCNEPSFVLGNSYASIRVPLDKKVNETFMGGPSSGGLVTFDTSYLVNENVWDGYFLSGLTKDDAALPPSTFSAIAKNSLPALNARITVLDPSMTKAKLINPADAVTSNEMAGKLAVDGAFNVNSTSVAAWRAVLAGMADLELSVFNPATNGANQWKKTDGVTFSRFSRNPGDKGDFWKGFVTLDETQLDNLARQIVKQVRARGPFRNLGDFVNRSLKRAASTYNGPDIRESGALQTALDSAEAGINSANAANVSGNAADLQGNHFEKILNGKPQATGYAGFVLQGDVLRAIAPIITVRSDTFVIRSYGSSTDASGKENAQAWCEAVVQRIPQPVEPTATPATTTIPFDAKTSLTHPSARFGRAFKLTSFRWLNPNEI